jgi:hypothetical protein
LRIPYILPFERNRMPINCTSIHNDIYVRNDRVINEGIGIDGARRLTGRTVSQFRLQDAQQPGPTRVVGRQVQIFRPAIRQNETARPKVYMNQDQARQDLAPAKIFDPKKKIDQD